LFPVPGETAAPRRSINARVHEKMKLRTVTLVLLGRKNTSANSAQALGDDLGSRRAVAKFFGGLDPAERAFNKLARTFTAQMLALSRYGANALSPAQRRVLIPASRGLPRLRAERSPRARSDPPPPRQALRHARDKGRALISASTSPRSAAVALISAPSPAPAEGRFCLMLRQPDDLGGGAPVEGIARASQFRQNNVAAPQYISAALRPCACSALLKSV